VASKQPILESTDRSEHDSGSNDSRDAQYMRRALALAQQGWGQTAPNPMVGAVVVSGDTIVGEGYHARYGEAHAEAIALKAAAERARGGTMYVTLEPCNHFGKTPPCTEAILEARIKRVVIAAADPTALAGGGARHLADYGVQVDFGVEETAALELNAPFFFAAANSSRPWVTLKLALSANDRMNDPTRERRWITNEQSRHEVHRIRANVDAIAVGLGTVKADDPLLTVRGPVRPRMEPLRVIFDRKAETSLDAKLVKTARETPTMIFANHPPVERLAALHNANVDVYEADGLRAALQALRDFNVESLLVEGGAQLAREFLREGLVDRLIIFRSPITLGSSGLNPFDGLPDTVHQAIDAARVVRRTEFGEDVMTVYALGEG
jgi:diaminohydroxyphosphoribosylaminopyrimidine deaminase / 5-amino-6-(5-phosphoribosylamino)uracil reductase